MSEWPKPETGEVYCNEVGDIFIAENTPVVVVAREQWDAMVKEIAAGRAAFPVTEFGTYWWCQNCQDEVDATFYETCTNCGHPTEVITPDATVHNARAALDAGLFGRELGDLV